MTAHRNTARRRGQRVFVVTAECRHVGWALPTTKLTLLAAKRILKWVCFGKKAFLGRCRAGMEISGPY